MALQIISTPPLDEPSAPQAAPDADEADDAADGEWRHLVVGAADHGQRLDKVLASGLKEFSRSWLQQLLRDGCVTVDGQAASKPAQRCVAGQAVAVLLRPTPQAQAFRPEAMPLEVVHEDEHLLVIVKPAGLVVHPAAGHWSGTLLNGLLAHHAGAQYLPRAGIVHRLDKDTSGLMLVAKSRQAMDALVRAIAERRVQRRYLALAHGPWRREPEVDVAQWIGRDPGHRLRMAVLPAESGGAKAAQTTFHCLHSDADMSLLACKLHTGRTHQIRVHAAWLGHPLLADKVYGGREQWGLQRQALHAAHLSLTHPVSGQPLVFHAPPPADMCAALSERGLGYNPGIWATKA